MRLQQGSEGKNTLQLQLYLEQAGFDPGPADGISGPRTAKAVARLQECCGITVDGVAGTAVLEALRLLLPHTPRKNYRLSEHFIETEFGCRCACNMVRVNVKLLAMLEKLRHILGGAPITVTSGYRCPAHNQAVGGAVSSRHLLGNAADITVANATPAQVADMAETLGFPGVGRYRNFTHVDVRPGGPARWRG